LPNCQFTAGDLSRKQNRAPDGVSGAR
jgi:hypothetical protein